MDSPQLIFKYFNKLSEKQQAQIVELGKVYEDLNSKINVISRKDMEHFYERHVLHSLAIAKFIRFKDGTNILDVGTGGGFPGIPLAILFPECQFHLVDSIGKKITVVKAAVEALGLKNVTPINGRAEQLTTQYHFIISRAVTRFEEFYNWVNGKFRKDEMNAMPNGIIYLKGGDLTEELKAFKSEVELADISNYFSEPFFETKKIVYMPV